MRGGRLYVPIWARFVFLALVLDVYYVDERLRVGDLKNALDHGDDILLRHGCGLSMTDVKRAREAWDRLRQRRQHGRFRTRLAA